MLITNLALFRKEVFTITDHSSFVSHNLAVYTDPRLDTFSTNRDYKMKSSRFRDQMLLLGGHFHCLLVEFQEKCYWEVERPTINI